jgi:L-threonylcarbamoyladenylate synthase
MQHCRNGFRADCLPANFRIQRAAQVLRAGGLVAYPTEAVWGLGCDPQDDIAVERLLALKQRTSDQGLILVAAAISQFDWLLADLSPAQGSRLQLSWPGPTTWLVPHLGRVPRWISGQYDTVALRVSDHPVVVALAQAFGGPIVSTSANTTGCQPALEQHQLRRYFGAELDYLVPGRLGGQSRPSMIRDLTSDTIIRSA